MKKSEIVNDPNIKQIPIENIDKDVSKIKTITTIEEPKTRKIVETVTIIGLFLVGVFAVFGITYLLTNTRFVQGDIEGAIVQLLGFSIVADDYVPTEYVKEGRAIYYGGETKSLICLAGDYKLGKVERVTDRKVYLQGSVKETVINLSEVDFVLSS